MPIDVTTPSDLIPMLTRLDDVIAKVRVLDEESQQTADALQAHERRLTQMQNDLDRALAALARLR